jgi:hypothetical protein
MPTTSPILLLELMRITPAKKYTASYCVSQSENTTYRITQWNITLLNNKKYLIKNHGFASFAGCDTRAEKGDNIRGRQRNQQWIIKETRIKGQFTSVPQFPTTSSLWLISTKHFAHGRRRLLGSH